MNTAAARPRLVAYSDAELVAGAEQSLATLVDHLDPAVQVVAAGPYPEVLRHLIGGRPGSDIAILPKLADKSDVGNAVAVGRKLRSIGPAAIHLNKSDVGDLRYVEWLARAGTSMRVISVVHHVEMPPGVGARWLCRRLASRADAVVAVGDSLARELETILRLPHGRVEAITNALPPVSPTPRTSDGRFVVGVLARLVRHKQVDDLIAAVSRTEGVHLLIGGDGPERMTLERLAWGSGAAARVEFLGWVEPDRVLTNCDLMASAATIEGHPMALLDARRQGIPIVAADVGAVGAIVDHGTTGFLVRPGDVDGFAAAISTLAADRRLLASMGLAARAAAEAAPGPESMARAYSDLYWPGGRLGSRTPTEPDAEPDGGTRDGGGPEGRLS